MKSQSAAKKPLAPEQATLRDLRYNFKVIQAALDRGREVTITRRGKKIATLTPEPMEPKEVIWPDFDARIRKIFGDRKLDVDIVEMLREDRDRY